MQPSWTIIDQLKNGALANGQSILSLCWVHKFMACFGLKKGFGVYAKSGTKASGGIATYWVFSGNPMEIYQFPCFSIKLS